MDPVTVLILATSAAKLETTLLGLAGARNYTPARIVCWAANPDAELFACGRLDFTCKYADNTPQNRGLALAQAVTQCGAGKVVVMNDGVFPLDYWLDFLCDAAKHAEQTGTPHIYNSECLNVPVPPTFFKDNLFKSYLRLPTAEWRAMAMGMHSKIAEPCFVAPVLIDKATALTFGTFTPREDDPDEPWQNRYGVCKDDRTHQYQPKTCLTSFVMYPYTQPEPKEEP